MIANWSSLAGKYRTKGVLLDTNLLVLLFVGLLDANRIKSFKRTVNQGFTGDEFLLLKNVVEFFPKRVTTTHILTETCNLIRGEMYGDGLHLVMKIIAETIQSFKERRPESKNLVKAGFFERFGLTDSAILDLPPKKYLVLSVDANLVIALQKKGVDALNFNHIRQQNWES